MTKKSKISLALGILLLASLACGLTDTVTGAVGNTIGDTISNTIGGETIFTSSAQLWADVPRMDGFETSELEVPLTAKLIMQTMMSQFLAEGKGSADWIVFSTNNTVDAIQEFYSNALLGVNGWENSEESTCFSGSDQGIDQVGLFCVFAKQEGGNNIGLLIISAPDEGNAGKNNVFFIRVEAREATPTP